MEILRRTTAFFCFSRHAVEVPAPIFIHLHHQPLLSLLAFQRVPHNGAGRDAMPVLSCDLAGFDGLYPIAVIPAVKPEYDFLGDGGLTMPVEQAGPGLAPDTFLGTVPAFSVEDRAPDVDDHIRTRGSIYTAAPLPPILLNRFHPSLRFIAVDARY